MVADSYADFMQKASPLFDTLHNLGVDCIPFKTRLSFAPLIQYIRQCADNNNFGDSFLAKAILERVDKAPELKNPIEDSSILEKHRDTVEMMMTMLIPAALRHSQLSKVSAPFELAPFYMTPAVEKMMMQQQVHFEVNKNVTEMMQNTTTVMACSLILNKFYGKSLNIEPLVSFTMTFPETGVVKHFKAQMNTDYVEIHALEKPKPLSEEQINQLLSNIYDLDLWLYHLPPENFAFHGIVTTTMVDITEEEALSRMKQQLLSKDAIIEAGNFVELECLVKTFFNMPDVRLGITAIDYPVEDSVAHKYKIRFDFLAEQFEHLLDPQFAGSIYEKICKYKETLLIEDLERFNPKTLLEKALVAQGIRSIILAPLLDKDEKVIGLLEIGSPRSYELHSFVELKLKEVVSLFTLAVERSREEIDNRVEAMLRAQFTAVHPSVEWKFMDASYNLLEKRDKGDAQARVEPIVFQDVYPLYGQADIVGSSTHRNQGIQTDMLDNLNLAKKVLEKSNSVAHYPLASHLLMKLNRKIAQLQQEFNSQDETAIVELLHEEVHPMLQHLRKRYSDLAGPIAHYFDSLDADLGIIYNKRKDFEESVAMLNSHISSYLEKAQRDLQQMLPHYFEKYQTDGVEFEMYVGQSLLRMDEFNSMHLKNFRLWQLTAMCEITRRVRNLREQLPVPLSTAQLIFAYTTPLSIRFRMDEKRFDVDGAYNVRYGILKKRIDKATIEGTNERLTVADKIAIVYLQEKDRQEYLEYIEYLQHEGWVTDEVEDLQIGRLQGAQGLRALRVTIKY
ncbi:MAG: hypothetical protein SFU99_16520 [Saprospiraceae bacterium]|nr:hypothetical protein [Saprospiraceae bacterium]